MFNENDNNKRSIKGTSINSMIGNNMVINTLFLQFDENSVLSLMRIVTYYLCIKVSVRFRDYVE